jgi:hypothetical protein
LFDEEGRFIRLWQPQELEKKPENVEISYMVDLNTLQKAKRKRCERMSDLINDSSP